MTEYIKREDAIDAVLDVYYNTPDIDLNGERLETAILKVQPADTVPAGRLRGVTYEDGNVTSVHIMDTDDVVKVFAPVVHGRWVFGKDLPDSFGSMSKNKYHLYCSECRNQAFNNSADNDCDFDIDTPFCPWCGAKMDGDVDND